MTVESPKPTASARGMWLALGFVLSLFLVPYVFGMTLPDDFDGAVQAELEATPQAVWDAIADYSAHPVSGESASGVDARPSDGAGPRWVERLERTALEVRTLSSRAPRELERLAVDATNGVETTWRYELVEPEPGRTRILVRQHIRIVEPTFTTPYFRVFAHYLDFAQQAPRDYVVGLARGMQLTEPTVSPADSVVSLDPPAEEPADD